MRLSKRIRTFIFVISYIVSSVSASSEDYIINQNETKDSSEVFTSFNDENSFLGTFAVTGNGIVFQRDGVLKNDGKLVV